MWCGCTAKVQHGVKGPQPFCTEDGEIKSAARSSSSSNAGQDGWSKMQQLVPSSHPKIQGVVLGGETVLFDLRTGQCYRLNPKQTAIWETCTGTATLQDIVRTLSLRLHAPMERVHEDVMASVVQWSHDGLLVQSEPHEGNLPARSKFCSTGRERGERAQ